MMEGERNETRNHQVLQDMYKELEIKLNARNTIVFNKEIALPCAIVNDSDILDDNIPCIQPHKQLHHNEQLISLLINNIHNLKRSSEIEMDFVINEVVEDEDEVSEAVVRIRQQSEKLFKKIINTQVCFNECLNDSLLTKNLEKKEYLKQHSNLVEHTCKFDRGIDSIIHCDKNTVEKYVGKDLKIESMDEFKNMYNGLAQGMITKIYEAATKKFKNHEHLLSLKHYNKSSTELVGEIMTEGILDPFTRNTITKPVFNKVCKHVYNQDSIDQMFQGKLFIHCPYIGCINKHVTKNDLLYNLNNVNENN